MLRAVGGATAAGLAGCFIRCGDIRSYRSLSLSVTDGPSQADGGWTTGVSVELEMVATGDEPFETARLVAYDEDMTRLTRSELTPFSEDEGYERTHEESKCADSYRYTGEVTLRTERPPKYVNAYVPPSACVSDYGSNIHPVVVGSDERPGFRCGERFPFAVLDVQDAPAHDHQDWPRPWFDASRSGHNPNGTGVSGSLEVAWTVSVGRTSPPPVVDAGAVVVSAHGPYEGDSERQVPRGALAALDLETGAIGWLRPHADIDYQVSIAGGRVFAAHHEVVAIDLATDAEHWGVGVAEESSRAQARTPPTVAHGQVYLVDDDARLVVFDAETGARAWTASTGEPVGTVAAGAGRVYAANAGEVHALSPDGTNQWTHTAEGVAGPPRVGPDGVYVATVDGVLALDPDGSQRWRRSIDLTTESVVVGESTVYAPGTDEIRAYAAADGSVRWRASLDGWVRLRGLVGDSLHVATDDALHVLDASSGERVTEVAAERGFHEPVVAGDYVLDVTEDGVLRALTSG